MVGWVGGKRYLAEDGLLLLLAGASPSFSSFSSLTFSAAVWASPPAPPLGPTTIHSSSSSSPPLWWGSADMLWVGGWVSGWVGGA